jgi:hypothetical protein
MFGGIYRLYYYLFPKFKDEISWEIRATDSPDKFPSQAIIDFLKYYIHLGKPSIQIMSATKPVLLIEKIETNKPGILRFTTSGHSDISQGNNNIKFDLKGSDIGWWPNPNVCPENSITAYATL